jgi:hypothetical protein
MSSKQDAVPIADLAHQRPVIRGGDDHAPSALYRLRDERGHGVRSLKDDLALEKFGAYLA